MAGGDGADAMMVGSVADDDFRVVVVVVVVVDVDVGAVDPGVLTFGVDCGGVGGVVDLGCGC